MSITGCMVNQVNSSFLECGHTTTLAEHNITVKPVLSDHIKQDIFWLFRQVVAYCCMKVVQKSSCRSFLRYFHSAISNHLSIAISMSPEWMAAYNRYNGKLHVYAHIENSNGTDK